MDPINLAMVTSMSSWIGAAIKSHQPRSSSVGEDPFCGLEMADPHAWFLESTARVEAADCESQEFSEWQNPLMALL